MDQFQKLIRCRCNLVITFFHITICSLILCDILLVLQTDRLGLHKFLYLCRACIKKEMCCGCFLLFCCLFLHKVTQQSAMLLKRQLCCKGSVTYWTHKSWPSLRVYNFLTFYKLTVKTVYTYLKCSNFGLNNTFGDRDSEFPFLWRESKCKSLRNLIFLDRL